MEFCRGIDFFLGVCFKGEDDKIDVEVNGVDDEKDVIVIFQQNQKLKKIVIGIVGDQEDG